jgi:hypothetical protein
MPVLRGILNWEVPRWVADLRRAEPLRLTPCAFSLGWIGGGRIGEGAGGGGGAGAGAGVGIGTGGGGAGLFFFLPKHISFLPFYL